ncbi:hypothetical protein TraAM80_03753 [Trypanosoma rangeli]|uniref:SUN domain-containing protein n=1 Tax=Trypanosoma rangeli TaxID=5698 RepID=A0A3R7NHR9_TRYRA|nr:uncharacterized protein TraAM80_03753 [Trypanosoma rangeli]RNF06730.1 hypothetical protein TraAM80_03753 [Trypanosoma rangeli]|eukprot:RNF06730.1 hypothetical protein TraAM80_03753 [Trypanosoma rangeli]
MKTDRLLTLLALALMAVTCSLLVVNSGTSDRREENPKRKSSFFTTNYAAAYLGATLTDFNRACKGASSVLNDEKEKYMICACEAARKLFTVQLIREIEVRVVTLVNMEHFSSSVKKFVLLGSKKYPTNEWRVLGEFEASPWRGTQHFDVPTQEPVRFLRFMWATSHGDDSWCTLTSFKAFGVDVLETLTEEYGADVEELLQGPLDRALPEPPIFVAPTLPVYTEVNDRTSGHAAALHHPNEGRKPQGDAALEKLFQQVDAIVSAATNCSSDDSDAAGDFSNCCNYGEPIDNASIMCMLQERQAFMARSRCKCLLKPVLPVRMALSPKSFQGGTVLQIITQMSKHLKVLQQELEEASFRQRETQARLENSEAVIASIGVHFRNILRITRDYSERLTDVKKEMDAVKSRLPLVLESRKQKSACATLKMWVACSNALALVALLAVCFVPRSNTPMGARRFTRRG